MDIHVVQPGDTLYSIAVQHGVSLSRLINDNQLPDPNRLVVGQTIVVQYPLRTYRVKAGDTLYSIACAHGTTVRQLLRNNPVLKGSDLLLPGQELVLTFRQKKEGSLAVNAYTYPFIDRELLQRTLPYLTSLTSFSYRFDAKGNLTYPDDKQIIAAAKQMDVAPMMCLANLTPEDSFSSDLASAVLNNKAAQNTLADNVMQAIRDRGFAGLVFDFESVYAKDAQSYARFVARMRERLAPLGIPVTVALVAKTSADQQGDLYQGHDYRLLGQAADYVQLMTYEWGYSYGPPMAVAPLRNVRQVVEYAVTEIPRKKIYLGIPLYGYNWLLPYQQGRAATSVSPQQAVTLAADHRAAIQFDEAAQSPWFHYVDSEGREHEVWFEDARSIRAKLTLAAEYGLYGVSYWNLTRPFPQNWVVLNALYDIRQA